MSARLAIEADPILVGSEVHDLAKARCSCALDWLIAVQHQLNGGEFDRAIDSLLESRKNMDLAAAYLSRMVRQKRGKAEWRWKETP